MDQAKKAAEELILKRFVSNKNLGLKVGAIRPLDPPDFKMKQYVDDAFKTIGVELTRVINPMLKKHESAQDTIVRMAQERFKATSNDKLIVYVYFSKATLVINRNLINSLADFLAKFATDVALKNKGFSFSVTTEDVELPSEFEMVSIETSDDFENWQPFGSFAVPYIDTSWFTDIINKKELKIANYRESFDERWLILAANFGHESSHFQFSNITSSFNESLFDRVFIYLFRDDKIIIIKDP